MYQLTTANNIILCTVLSQAKYHFHASAHAPTNFDSSMVLQGPPCNYGDLATRL